jgi:hypothetical protein
MCSKPQQLEIRTECSYKLLEEAAAQYKKTHHALQKLENGRANIGLFSERWDTRWTEPDEFHDERYA